MKKQVEALRNAESKARQARQELFETLRERLSTIVPKKGHKALSLGLQSLPDDILKEVALGRSVIILGQHDQCDHKFVQSYPHQDSWGSMRSRDYSFIADRIIIKSGAQRTRVYVCHIDWVRCYSAKTKAARAHLSNLTNETEYKNA